jgi:sugar lactone lactonase YvrE
VAVDGAGNLFIADLGNRRVRKVSRDGIITTVAGNGTSHSSGDGGPAISAGLDHPTAVAVDSAGNLFIGSGYYGDALIRKVSASGIITTVAGKGTGGSSGDGGPAITARLSLPLGVAADRAGNLFIADFNRIRRVSPDGIITTVAGNGTLGFSGDGGFAAGAQLFFAQGVAVDRAGNVYVAEADAFNAAVRVLRPTNRSVLISTVVDAASQSASPISSAITAMSVTRVGSIAASMNPTKEAPISHIEFITLSP